MTTKRGTEKSEEIDGTRFSDHLFGAGGGDTIHGGGGADFIFGDEGDDFLFGDFGNDRIKGGEGDDIMAGQGGTDQLFGEAGDDTLLTIAKGDSADGGAGNDFYQLMVGSTRTSDRNGDDEYEVNPNGRPSVYDARGKDELHFNDGDSHADDISKDDMTLKRQGDDLLIFVDGHGGKITLSLFYSSPATRIEALYDEVDNTTYSLVLKEIIQLNPGESVGGNDIW